MSIEDVKKRVDRELQETQQEAARVAKQRRQRELSYPTVKEWDEAVVSFADRIYKALFPGAWFGPQIVRRMNKFVVGGNPMIGGGGRGFRWTFRKKGISLSFKVSAGQDWQGNWPNPRIYHDPLYFDKGEGHKKVFNSLQELELSFEEIFEILYRELGH